MSVIEWTLAIAFTCQTIALGIVAYRNSRTQDTVEEMGHFVIGLTQAIRLELQNIKETKDVYTTID